MPAELPPKLTFAHLPTPVEHLPRLSQAFGGPRLWIKRDDQTGLAFGGNKTRKLEYLLGEAQAREAETLITVGAVQSNHCRQTAAAAARFGFECILVLTGSPPLGINGNLLLDRLLGAEIVWTEGRETDLVLHETFALAEGADRRPYLIPEGGSNAVGAAAYAAAMAEFLEQGPPVDRIILAASTGGTQAGLLAGAALHGFEGQVLGISVSPPGPELKSRIAALANETLELLGSDREIPADDVLINDRFVGAGYGKMGELERSAIEAFAKLEGVVLDPVYTGRAAGGLSALIEQGEIDAGEQVLFWHTGGGPALFAYADALTSEG